MFFKRVNGKFQLNKVNIFLWFTVVIMCMFGSILFGNQDAASDKLTPPEKTIRHARENLPKCIDTEDKKLTALAHSLYEKCLFDKLWEPKLPGLPYRWFSISGINDSSYGKCQLQWDTMFILNAWAPLDDDELMRDVFHNYWNVIDNNPEAPKGSYRYGMVCH